MPWHSRGGQRTTCCNRFPSSSTWDPGMGFRVSGLTVGTFSTEPSGQPSDAHLDSNALPNTMEISDCLLNTAVKIPGTISLG